MCPLAVPDKIIRLTLILDFIDRSAINHFIRHRRREAIYSHSTVAGGLLVISYTTRLMPGTSFVIRLLALSSTS